MKIGGGGTTVTGFHKNSGKAYFTPNFYTEYKKIYFEIYIHHNDNSKDHFISFIIKNDNMSDNEYVFEFLQVQINHSSNISGSESWINIQIGNDYEGNNNNDPSTVFKYYKPSRHPLYGIAIDFETGIIKVYENGTSEDNIIFTAYSNPLDISQFSNMKMYYERPGDGCNSSVNVTTWFGIDGFNYPIPEGYVPLSLINTYNGYEKDNLYGYEKISIE